MLLLNIKGGRHGSTHHRQLHETHTGDSRDTEQRARLRSIERFHSQASSEDVLRRGFQINKNQPPLTPSPSSSSFLIFFKSTFQSILLVSLFILSHLIFFLSKEFLRFISSPNSLNIRLLYWARINTFPKSIYSSIIFIFNISSHFEFPKKKMNPSF